MPPLRVVLTGVALTLALTSSAPAAVPHVVRPGETLWSIAAANDFTTRSLALYNGLSPDANVVLGSTIQVPTVAEAAARMGSGAGSSGSSSSAAPPPALGAYTVRPGDTLSGLAARSGVSTAALASLNGIAADTALVAGTALKLPVGSPALRGGSPNPTRATAAPPNAVGGRVTAADIATVANRNGVPAALASAIAWQESGFNNGVVSAANARGVMQVMPGTWTWVQQNLAKRRLDPSSPIDNVGAGVLYLGRLLSETGGDHRLAAAGYYQGLASVRRDGMLPETVRYVDDVMALRARFGG